MKILSPASSSPLSPSSVANDGLYVGRALVQRGSTQEGRLVVDGQTVGQMTVFLPDSNVAQAVATVTANGFVPFDRLDVLKKKENALPKVFKAAGKGGTEVSLGSDESRQVTLKMLLKGQFRNPPKAVVLGQGKELCFSDGESR